MQKGKVNIAQGYPETLSNLKIFQETQKRQHPEKNLKTLADAIDFAIQEASKVPALEKDISKLENGILDLSNELGNLTLENEELRKRIKELEDGTQIK